MSGLYIEEDKVCTKTIPAEPGFGYPSVKVEYRQALARVRVEHQHAAKQGAEAVIAVESRLLVKYVVGMNGEKVTTAQADRVWPNLRDKVLNLILGFAGPDVPEEEASTL